MKPSPTHSRASRRARSFLAALLLPLLSGCGGIEDHDVAPARAESAGHDEGLSWLARSGIASLLEISAMAGLHSGYVAMFARDGEVVYITTAGHADLETGRPMTLDTHFRIASMTKPVTAVAAMILVEEGRLALDDPVAKFIPAAAATRVVDHDVLERDGRIETVPLERPLVVRDLLQFSSGVGSGGDGSPLEEIWRERGLRSVDGPLAERVDQVLSLPLYEQPGEQWRYGWSADVLARVVEVAAEQPFGDFVEQRIIEPLGMTSTSYPTTAIDHDKLARVYTQDEAGNLVWVEQPETDTLDWTPGGSGLISTASDYMRFALMLWNGGEYAGTRILEPETVALMTEPHVGSGVLIEEGLEGLGWGLGMAVVVDADATPLIDREGDFWWSGYYGTHFFVSPDSGLVGVILSQNEPGPHSPRPYSVYVAPSLAFIGL